MGIHRQKNRASQESLIDGASLTKVPFYIPIHTTPNTNKIVSNHPKQIRAPNEQIHLPETLDLYMEISKPMHQRKWLLPMSFSLLTSSLLIILTLFTAVPFRHTPRIKPQVPVFVESKLQAEPPNPSSRIPRLAYLISGSRGDCGTLKRTLRALYHPLNQYVVHLDLEAKAEERIELVEYVKNEALFEKVGNVRVVVKSNLVTYRGPTMVSNTLHAAAILLKEAGDWDWFINLSASDYPLVTQDG